MSYIRVTRRVARLRSRAGRFTGYVCRFITFRWRGRRKLSCRSVWQFLTHGVDSSECRGASAKYNQNRNQRH